jgi:hypothetical protein
MKYQTVRLDNGFAGIIKIQNERVEALYFAKRGPLSFFQWNTWPPADHVLARFNPQEAEDYATWENEAQPE